MNEFSSTDASNYAAPAVPGLDIIIESSEYTVPQELGCSWIPEFVPVSEGVGTEEKSFLQSLQEPLPSETLEPAVAPTVTDVIPPTVPVTLARPETLPVTNESPSTTECVTPTDAGRPLYHRCKVNYEQTNKIIEGKKESHHMITLIFHFTSKINLFQANNGNCWWSVG